jgi:hypothetical protein
MDMPGLMACGVAVLVVVAGCWGCAARLYRLEGPLALSRGWHNLKRAEAAGRVAAENRERHGANRAAHGGPGSPQLSVGRCG